MTRGEIQTKMWEIRKWLEEHSLDNTRSDEEYDRIWVERMRKHKRRAKLQRALELNAYDRI